MAPSRSGSFFGSTPLAACYWQQHSRWSEASSTGGALLAQMLLLDSTGGFSENKNPGYSLSDRGFRKLEREKRLELSTSTLARWCSTN